MAMSFLPDSNLTKNALAMERFLDLINITLVWPQMWQKKNAGLNAKLWLKKVEHYNFPLFHFSGLILLYAHPKYE